MGILRFSVIISGSSRRRCFRCPYKRLWWRNYQEEAHPCKSCCVWKGWSQTHEDEVLYQRNSEQGCCWTWYETGRPLLHDKLRNVINLFYVLKPILFFFFRMNMAITYAVTYWCNLMTILPRPSLSKTIGLNLTRKQVLAIHYQLLP